MNKIGWKNVLVVGLSLLVSQLFYKIFEFNWWVVFLVLIMWFLFLKLPKKINWILLPILFLIVLAINKLFTFWTFNWEKIVWTNPDYLKLINRYWQEDLWLLFRIRNLFYSYWLLFFSWLDLVFKLLSPVFLVRMLGFSGFTLTLLGLIQFFKNKKKNWGPLVWWLVVVAASGWGMLVDSKSALILALLAIIYFMYLGVKNKSFHKYQKYWWLLLFVDFLLRW
jgi:hypothetical protein